jgi:negative regulator of sigma E activity
VNCEKVHIRLSAYMDGEVDAELHREIAGHLNQCAQCRGELEELGGVDAMLRGLPQYVLPADFAKAMVARVQDAVSPEHSGHLLHRAWKALLEYSEKFLELIEPEVRNGTRSLDEFNDIPASFIGHAYFRLLGSQK